MKEREIRGDGTCESSWLPWLAEKRLPTISMDNLCSPQSRLVIVAPHPDDEVLACGGLLAMRAARGLPCLIIAVTDGEASHGIGDPDASSRLAARRVEEGRYGLRALGVPATSVSRLGIPDGQAAERATAITTRLLALLLTGDVVVTTWCRDGHPDHEATCAATREAAALLGCSVLEAPVWMWHWSAPGDARVPWDRLMALDLTQDALAAKRLALARHSSQLEDRGAGQGPVLIPSIVQRAARGREYFFI